MSSSLKFKKVFIDTKFMTPDSNSTSDFKIELPETMYFDNKSSVFYIDDVCIPHSWYTVEQNMNDKLYIHVGLKDTYSGNSFIVTIDPGNYTPTELATELQTKINLQTATLGSNLFQCTRVAKTNRIDISINPVNTLSGSTGFYLLSAADLKTKLNGIFSLSYDVNNPNDCNDLIGNYISNDFILKTITWNKGVVNLQPIRNIYIHSSALGNLHNIGPDGSQTVIKKVPVTADYNNFIFDQTVLYNDYNSCSGQTLKKIDFQFKTSQGKVINFHGVNISLSIVFSRAEPDA
jgi:hypothetical protein